MPDIIGSLVSCLVSGGIYDLSKTSASVAVSKIKECLKSWVISDEEAAAIAKHLTGANAEELKASIESDTELVTLLQSVVANNNNNNNIGDINISGDNVNVTVTQNIAKDSKTKKKLNQ